jgi:hypothetical protein
MSFSFTPKQPGAGPPRSISPSDCRLNPSGMVVRALVFIGREECRLAEGNRLQVFSQSHAGVMKELRAKSDILDGEIASLTEHFLSVT